MNATYIHAECIHVGCELGFCCEKISKHVDISIRMFWDFSGYLFYFPRAKSIS